MPDMVESPALREAKEAAAWGEFVPLKSDVDTLEPFPLHVFPQALHDLCAQAGESVGCPPDYAASHALAVAAGAIGGSFDLQVKRGYRANSNLWICVVAPPGSGKSPSAAPILAPVYREYGHRLKRRQDGADDERTKAHVFVSDVTVERLIQMLNESPRGFPMIWDEMAGFLTGFNQYKANGQGSDRSHYLSIWDGRAVKVNRVGSKEKNGEPREHWAKQPRLSLIGGIQPEVLESLRSGPSDGLFDRLLFSFPIDRGMAIETWAEIDDAPCEAWERALQWLWLLKMDPVLNSTGDQTKDRRPKTMKLNEDARGVWKDWTIEIADEVAKEDAPTYLRSIGAKIVGYVARLALVIKLLREAYGEVLEPGVGPEDLLRAIFLGRYFKAHAHRVYQASGRDDRILRAEAILRWASTFKESQWTQSQAWARLRNNSLFKESIDTMDKPLQMLIDHNAIRTVALENRGRGRPAKGGPYELNPSQRKEPVVEPPVEVAIVSTPETQ